MNDTFTALDDERLATYLAQTGTSSFFSEELFERLVEYCSWARGWSAVDWSNHYANHSDFFDERIQFLRTYNGSPVKRGQSKHLKSTPARYSNQRSTWSSNRKVNGEANPQAVAHKELYDDEEEEEEEEESTPRNISSHWSRARHHQSASESTKSRSKRKRASSESSFNPELEDDGTTPADLYDPQSPQTSRQGSPKRARIDDLPSWTPLTRSAARKAASKPVETSGSDIDTSTGRGVTRTAPVDDSRWSAHDGDDIPATAAHPTLFPRSSPETGQSDPKDPRPTHASAKPTNTQREPTVHETDSPPPPVDEVDRILFSKSRSSQSRPRPTQDSSYSTGSSSWPPRRGWRSSGTDVWTTAPVPNAGNIGLVLNPTLSVQPLSQSNEVRGSNASNPEAHVAPPKSLTTATTRQPFPGQNRVAQPAYSQPQHQIADGQLFGPSSSGSEKEEKNAQLFNAIVTESASSAKGDRPTKRASIVHPGPVRLSLEKHLTLPPKPSTPVPAPAVLQPPAEKSTVEPDAQDTPLPRLNLEAFTQARTKTAKRERRRRSSGISVTLAPQSMTASKKALAPRRSRLSMNTRSSPSPLTRSGSRLSLSASATVSRLPSPKPLLTINRISSPDLELIHQIGVRTLLEGFVENRGFAEHVVMDVWREVQDLERTDEVLASMGKAAVDVGEVDDEEGEEEEVARWIMGDESDPEDDVQVGTDEEMTADAVANA